VRDLLRGDTTGLPSGEAVAGLIGVPALTADEVEPAWPGGTPLWVYVLKEAEHRGGGDRLGPDGGLIVAEVLVGRLPLAQRRAGLGPAVRRTILTRRPPGVAVPTSREVNHDPTGRVQRAGT